MEADLRDWLEAGGERFLREVGIKPGQAILDFGCRRGTYTIPAARIVGPQGIVYAVDKDPQALDELMRLASAAELSNIRRVDAPGGVTIPLADDSLDVVLLYDVIHLMGYNEGDDGPARRSTAADRRLLLVEVHRITKPAGLLSVYCAQHLTTHTDVDSEARIQAEIESCGFSLDTELRTDIIHDDVLVHDHIFNFTKAR